MEPQFHEVLAGQVESRTILEFLNEDCWHIVLDYVPIQDILRTERTSRQWQSVVLRYLSHVQINIGWQDQNNHRNLILRKQTSYYSFKCWTHKLGPSVTAFEKYGDSDDGMRTLRKNCPNIARIKLMACVNRLPPNNTQEHFHHLQQLCLEKCNEFTDDCISQFLSSDVLEKLIILGNKRVTGQCLTNLKSTKLKSLVFRSCYDLKFPPLFSTADRLGNVTKLVLARARNSIRDRVNLLIDKMPKLEYLTVLILSEHDDDLQRSEIFFESVCRLKNLRHLSSHFCTWDKHLEAVTRCCKQLEVLKLNCGNVTGRGAEAVRRNVGARLTAMDLARSTVTEDDVVAFVYACPNLKWLRVSFCQVREVELGRRVADARRKMAAAVRLHLAIQDCILDDDEEVDQHNELKDVLDVHTRDDMFDSDDTEDHSYEEDSD